MIITRTPFRITLGGGGTDLPSYYSKHGGFIFSVGIDKYMFINVNRQVTDDLIRLKYSESEEVKKVGDLKHDIAKEILKKMGFNKRIEISSMADIAAGTGLGSSSCYAVGVLHALHVLNRDYVSLQKLAEEDFSLEANTLKRPIGKQDPYLAAFGGFTVLDISKNGDVKVKKAKVSLDTMDELNRNLLLFFTHTYRNADGILVNQSKNLQQKDGKAVKSMNYIKELGYKILDAVESGNLEKMGYFFDLHWEHKKNLSNKISNPEFDKIYKLAKESGALGGKISGAGGGGFFAFYVPEKHFEFRKIMLGAGLREMRYRFDLEGSKVLTDF